MQTEGGVGRPAPNMQTEGGVGRPAPNMQTESGVAGPAPNVQIEGGVGRPAPNMQTEGGVGGPAPNNEKTLSRSERRQLLFMAAVAGETIKGFHVAHEACRLLRQTRSDFELVVTFDPPGQIDEFTRSVGWCSQADLPRQYRAADICLVPTIAQDGPSITSVEAMAAGIPVIASRIGGVPYTVSDGVTGLLCGPGDPVNLAANIARLLDDTDLRRVFWCWAVCRPAGATTYQPRATPWGTTGIERSTSPERAAQSRNPLMSQSRVKNLVHLVYARRFALTGLGRSGRNQRT